MHLLDYVFKNNRKKYLPTVRDTHFIRTMTELKYKHEEDYTMETLAISKVLWLYQYQTKQTSEQEIVPTINISIS